MAKHASWRLVKQHRCYTVDEASRLLKIGKPTIRRWIKRDGLEIIGDKKPFLIRGHNLKSFIQAKKQPKQKCALDECYCFTCSTPRKPAFSEVEITRSNQATEMMEALCNTCSGVMFKRISRTQIPMIQELLNVTFKQAPEPIRDTPSPCLNVNLKKEEIHV
jgi:excisionase family DNA binding protein